MKVLIVLGCAPSAKEELEKALTLTSGDFLAVGIDALNIFKALPIKYFATYHPHDIPEDRPFTVICHIQYRGWVDIVRPIDTRKEPSGSSALLGSLVAIEQGYSRIILCGCPLEGKNIKSQSYAAFRKGWEFHKNELLGVVKSMSGWTKNFLGEPTTSWLKGEENGSAGVIQK